MTGNGRDERVEGLKDGGESQRCTGPMWMEIGNSGCDSGLFATRSGYQGPGIGASATDVFAWAYVISNDCGWWTRDKAN